MAKTTKDERLRVIDSLSELQKTHKAILDKYSIATKARIQLYSDDFSTATLTLLEAVELAKLRISETAAMNLIREFEKSLKEYRGGSGQNDLWISIYHINFVNNSPHVLTFAISVFRNLFIPWYRHFVALCIC